MLINPERNPSGATGMVLSSSREMGVPGVDWELAGDAGDADLDEDNRIGFLLRAMAKLAMGSGATGRMEGMTIPHLTRFTNRPLTGFTAIAPNGMVFNLSGSY